MDAMLALGLVACAGLLVRLWRENSKLVASRRRTCALIRRVRRQRDDAREDFHSAIETAVEMQRELDRVEERRAGRGVFRKELN